MYIYSGKNCEDEAMKGEEEWNGAGA